MNTLLKKDGTQKLLASLLSIFIGLAVGAIVVAIVGLVKDNIGVSGMWDGIRVIFIGLFANGRDAAGNGQTTQDLGCVPAHTSPRCLCKCFQVHVRTSVKI